MGNQPGKLQHQNQSNRPKKNVHWKSAERPSPPGRPSLIPLSDQQPDVVNLRWERPKTDGGSPITGYVVEHRRMGSPHWVRATPTPVPRCEASLSGLEPGWRYQFRVFAENIVGRSEPSELSDPLTVTLQRNAISVPRFIDELLDMQAVEDERIEFRVRVVGQPPPEINWFKDGYEIFSSRRTKIVNDNDASVLIIHQVALTDEGEIKCTATNRAGHVVTKSRLLVQAPPRIRLPRTYEDGLIVEADEVLRLKVGIAGQPPPAVTWLHEGEVMMHGERFEIANTERNSLLKINNVQRNDRGEYSIRAWNKLGEDVASFLVTVTARPDPPGKVRLNMSFGKSATLSWTAPIDDGGCKIGNYIVEYFRVGWNVWLKAATTRSLSTTLNDLIEGSEYKFRVKAENPYGLSDPSEESDVLFIPDPKRGITKPKSETKIAEEKNKPLPPRRKTLSPPRPHQDAATETTSHISPTAARKTKPQVLDNDELHREMSYGTPDQVLKMDVRKSPSLSSADSAKPAKFNANNTHKSPPQSTPETEQFLSAQPNKQANKDKPRSPLLQKMLPNFTSNNHAATKAEKHETTTKRNLSPAKHAAAPTMAEQHARKPSPSSTSSPYALRKSATPPEPIKTTAALQRSAEPVQLGVNQHVRRYSGHSLSPAKHVPALAIAIATSAATTVAAAVNINNNTISSNTAEKQNAATITNPTIQISAPPAAAPQSPPLSKTPATSTPQTPPTPTTPTKTTPISFPPPPPPLRISPSPPSPALAPLSTTDRHDDVHTSNEFMLVVFDKNSKVKDKDKQDSFELDLEDALQPPPISISAPDLASLEFTNLHTTFPIRRSVSSTELLYERAMARFYEAVELEEAEKARKARPQPPQQQPTTTTTGSPTGAGVGAGTGTGTTPTSSNIQPAFVRKRLGSMTEAERLSFERRSEMRRLSADFTTQDFKSGPTKWGSRDNISQLKSFSRNAHRFMQKQSFESQESDEVSDDFQAHSAPNKTDSYELGSDYTDSTAPSEEDSIEKFKMELMARTRSPSPKELETYHPRDMTAGIFTPYRAPTPDHAAVVLNRPMPLPSPDFVPKPILKRSSNEQMQQQQPQQQQQSQQQLQPQQPSEQIPVEKSLDIAKGIKSFFKRDKRDKHIAPETEPSVSPNESKRKPESTKTAITTTTTANNILTPIGTGTASSVKDPDVISKRQIKEEEERKRQEAQRIMQEEAHAAADHYGDLVRQVSSTRKYHTPIYMDRDELRKAAERATQEGSDVDDGGAGGHGNNSAGNEDFSTQLRSHSPDIGLIPPISNKPRLSISERGQMVHVRQTASNLAMTAGNRASTPSDEDLPQFPLMTPDLPIPDALQLNEPAPAMMNDSQEDLTTATATATATVTVDESSINEMTTTTTTVISETLEERPDSRGRSRIVKVRRIVKKRVPSRSRDVSTSRPSLNFNASQEADSMKGTNEAANVPPPMGKRRVLSQTRRSGTTTAESHSPGPYGRRMEIKDFAIVATQNEILEVKTNEQMCEEAHEKVRSALSYSTDLVLFVVACYVYLFKDARLVLPILALMIYRQLGEAIVAYIPNWMKRKKN